MLTFKKLSNSDTYIRRYWARYYLLESDTKTCYRVILQPNEPVHIHTFKTGMELWKHRSYLSNITQFAQSTNTLNYRKKHIWCSFLMADDFGDSIFIEECNFNELKAMHSPTIVTISYNKITTLPEVDELTLTSGADFILRCIGDVPVTWVRDEVESIRIKNSSINISHITNVDGYNHMSLLSLSNVNFSTIGYYTCLSKNSKNVTQVKIEMFKKIYIFVQDNAHLLLHSKINVLHQDEFGFITIPCIPTSPFVNVTLKKDGKAITENLDFNNKKGFIHWFFWRGDSYKYTCEAKMSEFGENQSFTVRKNPKASRIVITAKPLNHTRSNQNVTLNCTVYAHPNTIFTIEWEIPKKLGPNRVRKYPGKYLNEPNRRVGTLLLDIRNFTVDNSDGSVACKVKFSNVKDNKVYYTSGKIALPNASLDLRIVEGDKTMIRPAGNVARWLLQLVPVHTINATSFTWYIGDERNLTTNSNRLWVENNLSTTKLTINDLKSSDSGVYTLRVDVDRHRPITEHLRLVVKGIPLIRVTKSSSNSNAKTLSCEMEKKNVFEFRVSGYPLPKVRWDFKSYGANNFNNKETHDQKPVIKSQVTILSETELEIVTSVNVAENGTLFLNASNVFGSTIENYTVMFIDVTIFKNELQFFNQSTMKIENTTNKFNWKLSDNSFNHTNVTIFKNELQFFNQSTMKIENTTNEFNENISISTELKKTKDLSKKKSTTINVEAEPNERKISIVIIVCCASIIIFGSFVIFAIYLKKKTKFRKTLHFDSTVHFQNEDFDKQNHPHLETEEPANLFYGPQWEFPRENLKFGKLLSSGMFSVMIKAKAIGIAEKNVTTTVAVKTVQSNADPYYLNILASELTIMIHLGRHINVIDLLGAYTMEVDKNLIIILEYCRFGNIRKYLSKLKSHFVNQFTPVASTGYEHRTAVTEKLSSGQILDRMIAVSANDDDGSFAKFSSNDRLVYGKFDPKNSYNDSDGGKKTSTDVESLCTYDLIYWSFQIAKGMEFIASRKVIHCDLAARNIYLTVGNVVKICDFKFAKNMQHSDFYKNTSKKDLFPLKWMAIESIRDRVFSTQSDVWSFGIVLWEIFTLAASPYKNIQIRNLFNRLVKGYRMEQPEFSNRKIYQIMLDCWKSEPSKRPSFTELSKHLGDFLHDGTKKCYTSLNENYMGMSNTRFSTSNHSSSSPEQSHSNSLSTSVTYLGDRSQPDGSECSNPNDVMEQKSMPS